MCRHFMWAFAVALSVIIFIVSHCRSSFQCHTPSAEEQAQAEEAQEGASLTQSPQPFSSRPSLSAPFPSHLLPLGLRRRTTHRDARAPPFWRRTPGTSSLPTPAMGAASTPFLGWKLLRLRPFIWSILVLLRLLRDSALGNLCISQDSLTRVCTA